VTEIIFKSEVDNVNTDALSLFLKTWGINAEDSDERKRTKKVIFTDFGLALPQDCKFNREEDKVYNFLY
jgi:hypothetical protein